MEITFGKAPLIELIAELRWAPQGTVSVAPVSSQQCPPPTLFLGGSKQEEFYARLGQALYKEGFSRSERLLPPGIPFLLQQPVYRFLSNDENKKSVIYQVGFGVFSVHAVPPYHSWSQFLPLATNGVEILLKSRLETDALQPFEQVSLRYIDFFGEQLMQGQSIQDFISGVFGIGITLPDALRNSAISNDVKGLYTKVVLPIKNGELTLSVGDGQFNNQQGVVVDWMASSHGVTPDQTAVMEAFGSEYDLIHGLFMGLTRPLYQLMEPQEGSTQ